VLAVFSEPTATEERALAFKTARLESPPPIVLVDGLWLKLAVPTGDIKSDRLGRQRRVNHKKKRVMLTALGSRRSSRASSSKPSGKGQDNPATFARWQVLGRSRVADLVRFQRR
jgi:hypothetical protein